MKKKFRSKTECSKNDSRPQYDCDTFPYWVSTADYYAAKKRYGHFLDETSAYEITNPETPRPWLNYLCNDRFGAVVSNKGLGFSFYKTTLLRITRYDHPIDYLPREFRDGRRILYRKENGEWLDLFTSSGPSLKCTHRPGFTTLETEHDGIHFSWTLFVPRTDPGECHELHVRNTTDSRKAFRIAAEIIWSCAHFGIHTAEEGIPYISTPGRHQTTSTSPHCCSLYTNNDELPVELFSFFLSPDLRNTSVTPEIVAGTRGREFLFPHARLEDHISLGPKEERTLRFFLGATESSSEIEVLRTRYFAPDTYGKERRNLENFWNTRIQYPSVELPDKNLSRFLNVWFKNQLHLTFHYARSGHWGFRDTIQDAWGYTLLEPEIARERLLLVLRHVLRDGRCPRNFSKFGPNHPHDFRLFMDSGTWIPWALLDLIKETGDFSLLEEPLPYLDDPKPESVSRHVERVLDLLYERRGRYGLCLTGEGDWNDALEGISRDGDAVSAWLTIALFHAQNLYADLMDRIGDRSKAEKYRRRSAELKQALNDHAWDGEWYLYGFTGSGRPIGSHKNKEGRIHLNAQTWAIFTGLADEEKRRKIFASIDRHLQTPLGAALLAPPYVEEGDEVGRIARLEPGTFENGSVYQHAVAFQIFAELSAGRGERAYDLFRRILPTNPENFDARRTSEPYCTGNFYCGPGHPRFGQNFFSWFTGNVAWFLRAAYDEFLGVKADFDGLRFEPKVPRDWKEYRVIRRFRGDTYRIHFRRADNERDVGISERREKDTVFVECSFL